MRTGSQLLPLAARRTLWDAVWRVLLSPPPRHPDVVDDSRLPSDADSHNCTPSLETQ